MKNIIWQKPDGGLAVTNIADLESDAAIHAEHLQTLGAVPADWTVSAVDTIFVPAPVPPSVADLKLQALALARSQRAPIINVLDGMQASALTATDLTKAQAIQTAKQGLKDLTKIDLSACTTADDFKSKIMTRYREIAAALPVDVRIAFAEALQ